MAEEKVLTSSEACPTAVAETETEAEAAADSHKRKLEDLELNSASESLAETETNPDRGSGDNGAQEDGNGGADESETKRQRLESNGDNVSEADGQVSQNGHQEEEKQDEPKAEVSDQPEPKEDDAGQPEPADDNGGPVDGQEPVEGQEPMKEPSEPITDKPASDENEETEIAGANELSQPKAEVEESSELPRDGDVPVHSAEQEPGSSQILSRKMDVPNDKVGVLIGKAGDTIRSLQDNSGAKIQIMRDADADQRAPTRPLELVGTLESINKAERLIKDVIAEADAGGSPSLVARGFSTVQAVSGGEQIEIQVPIEKVGLIIGKGGETIRNLQTRSGARIQLIQQSPSDGEKSRDRTVRVTGNKKQIDIAREMIKDVMNQTVRPSPLSSGYSQQQGYRPRGPVAPQWGPRGPHHAQFSGYDYPQRGSYPSHGSQYPPPSYGNYPPPQAPRSNYGPVWEQRPPASMHGHGPPPQNNYNYGQHQGPEYVHPPPYSQPPTQPYGHSYNEVKYDNHSSTQHYGNMGPSQPASYSQGGTHMGGYNTPDQYGKQPPQQSYPYPQAPPPHSQPYGQPRPSQPAETIPYQGSATSAAQSYGQNMPPQQPYPYPSSGPMQQQSYPPPYGSAPTTDGYGHTHAPPPASASASGYPPQSGQPVAGYGQAPAQQPPAYPQTGPTGYGSYPTSQPGYGEQPAVSNAGYGYQGHADQGYGGQASGYAQPAQTQPAAYDQSVGYGNVAAAPAPAPAPVAYGKSASPQTAVYPQYDSSQMYGAHR